MTSCERILIVGGGIAGLTTAIALGRRGYRSTVIERSSGWAPTGAGLALLPNAMSVFESLGVAGDLEAVGVSEERLTLADVTGTVRYEVSRSRAYPPGFHELAISRAELLKVLLAHQPAPVRWDCAVTAARHNGGETIAELSDGTSAAFDLVIGADGVRSRLRELLFPDASLKFNGQNYWRGCLDSDVVNNWTTQYAEDARFFGCVPVGPEQTYWFAQLRTAEPIRLDPSGSLAQLRVSFADFGPPAATVLPLLHDGVDIHFGPIEEVLLDRWTCGSVVLIGDAAHALSPVARQGGGMAAEDGLVLAEELHRAENVAGALESFERRRQPRVDLVRRQTHRSLNSQAGISPGDKGFAERVTQGMRAQFEPFTSAP